MSCAEILNIIGNIASIITVIGGTYGFCKWIISRKAKVMVTKYHHSDQGLFLLYVHNYGAAEATNIKISTASAEYPIQTAAYIPRLQSGEEGQIGFSFRLSVPSLPIYIHWTDGMGQHKKRIIIMPSMRVR